MDQRTGMRANEVLLIIILGFQILDFFELLSPFWDYVKKIISWALIGYLLYRASPSRLFWGRRRRWWDFAIILGYFSMTLKNIVSFAAVAREVMIENVLEYVMFLPSKVAAANVTVPIGEAAVNSFTLLNGYLENASAYAKPFATQITISHPSIPFLFTGGNQSAGALLQPYGLDGLTFQLYNTLVAHASAIERIGFIVGAVAILALGLYGALKFRVREHSILHVIHEEGFVKDLLHGLIRILSVLLVVIVFFVIFFNLVVEWLAIAVDAPMAMIGIVVYVMISVRFHRRFHRGLDTDDLISRMGGFGNDFIKDFAKLFTEHKTVFLGLSGLLVLHLLTDIGVFVIPALTGLKDILYFGQLDLMHEPLFYHLSSSLTGTLSIDVSLAGLYILNAIGILFLLVLPAYIWYKAFKIRTLDEEEDEQEHHPALPFGVTPLGLVSIAAFLLCPAFAVTGLSGSSLIGVDIQTQPIILGDPTMLFGILCAFLVLLLIGDFFKQYRHFMMLPLFLAAILFFGTYIYRFFMSSITYYFTEGLALFTASGFSSLFIASWIFLFGLITLLFYVFGFLSFVYELLRD